MKIEKLAASKTNIFSTESKKGIFDVSDASLGLGNLLDTQKKEEEKKGRLKQMMDITRVIEYKMNLPKQPS